LQETTVKGSVEEELAKLKAEKARKKKGSSEEEEEEKEEEAAQVVQ
jgi:stalled ribosome alternative rescue factor ArfA